MIKEWVMALFGRSVTPGPEDPDHTILNERQNELAGRLSRLTGRKRDDVLAEAYRRGDARTRALKIEADSIRRR